MPIEIPVLLPDMKSQNLISGDISTILFRFTSILITQPIPTGQTRLCHFNTHQISLRYAFCPIRCPETKYHNNKFLLFSPTGGPAYILITNLFMLIHPIWHPQPRKIWLPPPLARLNLLLFSIIKRRSLGPIFEVSKTITQDEAVTCFSNYHPFVSSVDSVSAAYKLLYGIRKECALVPKWPCITMALENETWYGCRVISISSARFLQAAYDSAILLTLTQIWTGQSILG